MYHTDTMTSDRSAVVNTNVDRLNKVECLHSTDSSAHSAWRQVTMKPICETHVSMIITVCSEVYFYQPTTSEDITSTWETTATKSQFMSRRQI